MTAAAESLPESDVLIVGAGPAGLALACALHDAGWRVCLIEQADAAALSEPADDGREIALTHRSRRILDELGCWAGLARAATPLRLATVRSAGSARVLPFASPRHEALGWLLPNWRIRAALWQAAQGRGLTVECGETLRGLTRDDAGAELQARSGRRWRARLVVAADSRFSATRRLAGIAARSLDFGRSALLLPLAHALEHGGEAQECFLQRHTLALLPMAGGRRSSAVWTVDNAALPELLALDDKALAGRVEQACGGRLGAMRLAGARQVYPLVAVYAQRFVAPRLALIGDAAVGMHPVTAHGFNFGLYGIETLAQALRGRSDPGAAAALQAYEQRHRQATRFIYEGTNALVRLFSDSRPPALLLRRALLDLAAHLPPLRQAITRQLTGSSP